MQGRAEDVRGVTTGQEGRTDDGETVLSAGKPVPQVFDRLQDDLEMFVDVAEQARSTTRSSARASSCRGTIRLACVACQRLNGASQCVQVTLGSPSGLFARRC